MQRLRKTYPRTALVAVLVLGAAAVLWLLAGVPALVKYPTDLDVSPRYEGTFTVLVDPATAAPLEEPIELPLTVERHIEAVADESGASRVVVRETIRQQAGDLVDATQENVYVMDRSTFENVADERAYAFEPSNVVDRSPAYRLHLPFDTDRDETYQIYKNEIGASYELRADAADPTVTLEGLDLSNFVATVDEAPLDPAYLAALNEVVPLPQSLSLAQLEPQLEAVGIDVAAVLAALTPVLTPEDSAALASFAAEPIALEYVLTIDGSVAVEPTTGSEVRVGALETVGARPSSETLPALVELLGRYPQVPEAVAAIEGLDALAAAPATPLFRYEYLQTPASVADIADEVTSMRTQVLLAKQWLPLGLAAAAVVAFVIGLVVALRRRPAEVEAGPRLAEIPVEVRAEASITAATSTDTETEHPVGTG